MNDRISASIGVTCLGPVGWVLSRGQTPLAWLEREVCLGDGRVDHSGGGTGAVNSGCQVEGLGLVGLRGQDQDDV